MTISGESFKNPKLRLAVLLLAAGEGSRLGGIPKALLKKEGDTLLRRFLRSIECLNPVETLVITGFYADAIEAEIHSIKQKTGNSISIIKNLNPELGQSSSVRLGLESLKSDYDVLLVALCDQPNIGVSEIEDLLEQFNQAGFNKEIVLPMVNGGRGNPVLFSKKVIEEILATPKMVCRPFMDQHPALVKVFETNNQAYLLDVDTQADIQKLGLDPI
ncbi:NTP transferase domain-containing protein [Polynucleobacter sp. MWH-Aus1W21]|uniref:nucleotidyltransferase family protein n=1 Tax=Polynucleobacter sp. MWH-Aus1W21 TaxID=1855880 RepID=UPI001BFEACC5|nr:nucleotidyltransferase family protein [Polynucleobacter sp. MWH-Aus1W21]QWD67169.1 nucleotidyltransferase family protein [Polynucleobacter sp. MWH-Aus1W21]